MPANFVIGRKFTSVLPSLRGLFTRALSNQVRGECGERGKKGKKDEEEEEEKRVMKDLKREEKITLPETE